MAVPGGSRLIVKTHARGRITLPDDPARALTAGHGEPYSPGPVTCSPSRNDRAASYAASISVPV